MSKPFPTSLIHLLRSTARSASLLCFLFFLFFTGTAASDEPSDLYGDLKAPEAPTHLWAAPLGPNKVRLTWQDRSDNEARYSLELKELGYQGPFIEVPFPIPPNTNVIDLSGLPTRSSYLFRIRARNASGASAPSNLATVSTWRADAPCEPNPYRLCLLGGRFSVEVLFGPDDEIATAIPLTEEAGYFWFFTPDNLELMIDLGGPGRFTKEGNQASPESTDSIIKDISLRHLGLSDVEYSILLTDLVTGETQVHSSEGDRSCRMHVLQIADEADGTGGTGQIPPDGAFPPCEADSRTLCFQENRFQVRFDWLGRGSDKASASAVVGTSRTGFFLYNDLAPAGFAVKLLDGRSYNGKFWLYAGSMKPQDGRLTLLDTLTGVEYILNHEAVSCLSP